MYSISVTRFLPDCSACPVSCEDFNGCGSCPTGTRLPDCQTSRTAILPSTIPSN